MKKNLILLFLSGCILCSCAKKTGDKSSEHTIMVKQDPVRAVWIPDPSHTSALTTYADVKQTVNLFDSLGINMVYVCAWAKVQTAFKSEVLLKNTYYKTLEDTYMFQPWLKDYNTPLQSPSNDPLKDLISEAHAKGIKVVFWFEYGFMASIKETPKDNPILSQHPDWAGVGNDGLQSNYNGSDYYLNAYNPEVQHFLLDLVAESMSLYPDVDGIQGDDRMPAMPRNSGYDVYTVDRYKTEHGGKQPPKDFNDPEWVNWRLNILNQFAKQLYTTIKSHSSNALMCFSPNPYPWCEENLMQQWPQWTEDNLVDILSVQCYRYDIDAYKTVVATAQQYIKGDNQYILNPGIILKNGDKIMNKQLLLKQLQINENLGTNGEAFFYNEGLKDVAVQQVLTEVY